MTDEEIKSIIQDIIYENSDDDTKIKFGKAMSTGQEIQIAELGIDSLKMVEILMGIEEQLGVEIDLEEFEGMTTLSDLSNFCSNARP